MAEWFQEHYTLLIVILFGLVTIVNIFYYLFVFTKFAFHKPARIHDIRQDPVSIVISAKNEAHNLIKSLPHLLSQQYNHYEVVVVNDNSTDETEQVIRDFMVKAPHLKLVNLTSSVTNIQGKKFPLSIGIKSAKHEIILLTDADCIPSSPYWLQNMAKHFRGRTEIVLGYNTYEKRAGLLNKIIRFDNLHNAVQYFSYALINSPVAGNGRNLAYTKELFYKNKGFASHNHIKYGEDDIFVNKSANRNNCEIEYFKGAYTISRPKSGFANWLSQKKRHTATRRYYKGIHKFLLTLYGLSMPLFYILLIFCLTINLHNIILFSIILSLFLIKITFSYVIFGKAAYKLDEKSIIPWILPFDILFSIINPLVYITSIFSSRR